VVKGVVERAARSARGAVTQAAHGAKDLATPAGALAGAEGVGKVMAGVAKKVKDGVVHAGHRARDLATPRGALDAAEGFGRKLTGTVSDTGTMLKSTVSPTKWKEGLKNTLTGRMPEETLGHINPGRTSTLGAGTGVLVGGGGAYRDLTTKEDPTTGRQIGRGERIGRAAGNLASIIPMSTVPIRVGQGGLLRHTAASFVAGEVAAKGAGGIGRLVDKGLASRPTGGAIHGGSPAATGVR
jgi:hypothetical protein